MAHSIDDEIGIQLLAPQRDEAFAVHQLDMPDLLDCFLLEPVVRIRLVDRLAQHNIRVRPIRDALGSIEGQIRQIFRGIEIHKHAAAAEQQILARQQLHKLRRAGAVVVHIARKG